MGPFQPKEGKLRSSNYPDVCLPIFLLILSYSSPPVTHLWTSHTPSSDIIITDNPINTQHAKTKTSIIKLTVTYIYMYIHTTY
jgi:hypothetical protein